MVLSNRQMSVSCAEVEYILSPPKVRSPCLQRACNVRDTHVRCRASMRRLRPLWHRARMMEAQLLRSRLALNLHLATVQTVPAMHEVHHRALHARVCYVPTGDAAHAAVIAHCSITTACSLRAPASLKTRTGDVRRYGYGGLWPRHNQLQSIMLLWTQLGEKHWRRECLSVYF